ncbi:PUA-like domain-containing protein [Xylariomycetidae sp. FL2044]|nr:PUA-like domain-containing protein [Xylariomycetidae sp. FL2044]
MPPDDTTVRVWVVGESKQARIGHMRDQHKNIIQLASKSARAGVVLTIPNKELTPAEAERRYTALRRHLQWLETDLEMEPDIKEKTKPDIVFKRIFDEPKSHFPDDIKIRAEMLFNKWVADNWGADDVRDEADDDDAAEDLVDEGDTNGASNDGGATLPPSSSLKATRFPPREHPIYGVGGIMWGCIMVRGSNNMRVYRLNPTVPKRSAKVYGHNAVAVGAWFATQLVALHRGAHGARMGGIAGRRDTGAYSIVVSESYHDLDEDRGETLFYSGSGSHDNADPDAPALSTSCTDAMKASLRTKLPVRVLRSGRLSSGYKRSTYAPDCGLRYDGLYQVDRLHVKKNGKGGLYEQFELHRLPDQTPLSEIRLDCPTPEQRRHFGMIRDGY